MWIWAAMRLRKDSPTVYVTENFFSMLGIPEKKEENLTKERFQEIMTEFESVCKSSKGYAGDLIYHIPLPDGKIRYVRIETTSEADAQVGLVEDVTASPPSGFESSMSVITIR